MINSRTEILGAVIISGPGTCSTELGTCRGIISHVLYQGQWEEGAPLESDIFDFI